ncbi:MAG: LytR/AlgR family response regulator transcription factor [Salibacteraceae bacterium]
MTDPLKILIVEDEPVIAHEIGLCLSEMNHQVCPEVAMRGKEALAFATQCKPDLVLLDISLDGPMDGIEVGQQLQQQFKIPFIYLTAYADKLTLNRAKVTLPAAYLVKPFTKEELQAALEVAQYKLQHEEKPAKDNSSSKATPLKDELFVKDRDSYIRIKVQDILWVKGLDNYIVLHLRDGKQIIHSSLKKMEERLASQGFLRIHKSYIINLSEVSSICRSDVQLGNVEIPIGKTYRTSLMKRIDWM